jgi:prepilin-type N-terminal cleavage/methylation domain-containing protein
MNIDFDGPTSTTNAHTLRQVIEALLERIQARDEDLDLAALSRIVIADDLAATEHRFGVAPAGAEHLSRIVSDEGGLALLFDGSKLWQILSGDGAEIARLIHHLHKECWRLHDSRAPVPDSSDAPLARALAPIVAAMWQEYRINRRSAWSVPADSDLLLNHLAALLQALPDGMQEEITLYYAAQDLDDLFAKSLGRIAHLMQAVAHVQGYLDGLGQPLKAVSAEMHELVAGLLPVAHLAHHRPAPGRRPCHRRRRAGRHPPAPRRAGRLCHLRPADPRERGRQRRVAGCPAPRTPRNPALSDSLLPMDAPLAAGALLRATSNAICINIDPTYIPLGSNMQTSQRGFTLVEIAVVLVIIGLLLGGVLKGQELINSAKVKSVVSDFRSTSTYLFSYQDKFSRHAG